MEKKSSHGYITVTLSEEGIEAIAEAVARKLQEGFAANLAVAAPHRQTGMRSDPQMHKAGTSPATSEVPYMTEKEAAVYLTSLGVKFSHRTLQMQRVTGGGIPYRKLNTRVRYRKEDLDAWVMQHRAMKSTSET